MAHIFLGYQQAAVERKLAPWQVSCGSSRQMLPAHLTHTCVHLQYFAYCNPDNAPSCFYCLCVHASSACVAVSTHCLRMCCALQISTADMAAWEQLKRDSSSTSRVPQQAEPIQLPAEDGPETPVQRDWKGDPIKFNPGEYSVLVLCAVQALA